MSSAAASAAAREIGTGVVAGFYTLSASSVPLTDLPEAMRKTLPRYPSVPVAWIGRLAVDEPFKGMKLGAALLWDAVGAVGGEGLCRGGGHEG
jgi:hypothetical protein